MSKPVKLFAFAAIALMSVGVVAAGAQTPSKISADEAAVRQVVQKVQEGWNAHDGKAFASPFAENADYVVVRPVLAPGCGRRSRGMESGIPGGRRNEKSQRNEYDGHDQGQRQMEHRRFPKYADRDRKTLKVFEIISIIMH